MSSKEGEPISQKSKTKPYFVYFAEAHQTRAGKIIDARPFLTLAPNSIEALDTARAKIRGIKRHKFLAIKEADKKEFREKAKELLEEGVSLSDEVLSYAKLPKKEKELKR